MWPCLLSHSPSTIYIPLFLPSFTLLFSSHHQPQASTPRTSSTYNQITSSRTSSTTTPNIQHACLRVLLPVWRHDCHQHHLHRLRSQAVQQLPSVLNAFTEESLRRRQLSHSFSHCFNTCYGSDQKLQHHEMRVWKHSLK